MADYVRPFMAEELRLDGSNFIEWYLILCEVLHANTTTETTIYGAPNWYSVAHPQVCLVRHRILATKIFSVAHLSWCATEFSHSVAHLA